MKTFKEKVIEVVKQIPKGSVLTYKQVAKKAGNEKASRRVGTVMAQNQDTSVPCHRVIRSDGTLGRYNKLRGDSKQAVLQAEGYKMKMVKP